MYIKSLFQYSPLALMFDDNNTLFYSLYYKIAVEVYTDVDACMHT